MNQESLLFLITTFMEIATLACAFLGLRLYKHNQWLRLAIIVVPLILNGILYLIFKTTTFFYLGVMLLLCVPFVWPRKSA